MTVSVLPNVWVISGYDSRDKVLEQCYLVPISAEEVGGVPGFAG
jgi:hypothetical protein